VTIAVTSPQLRVQLVWGPAGLADQLRRELPAAVFANDGAPAGVHVYWLELAMLGERAGEIVAKLSRAPHRPGLIAVIAAGDTREREIVLAAGFDDAVTGSPSARELAVRIRAVSRRVHRAEAPDGRIRFGGLVLDSIHHTLWAHGVAITLTPVEAAVMRVLLAARGRPLTRTQLLDEAWGDDALAIGERAVDNVILRLRRKLPRPDDIETVRGVGFRVVG